jgi:hypothetical protein
MKNVHLRKCYIKKERITCQGYMLSEETAFKSLFQAHCENQGLTILGEYPFYEIQKNSMKMALKIVEPFLIAEINDKKSIKKAIPKNIVQEILKEFRAIEKMAMETDLNRFAEITCLCSEIILNFEANPKKIVKIKNLLQFVKKTYTLLGYNVRETESLNNALNQGIIKAELLPGRDPSDLVNFHLPNGEIKRYALMRIEKIKSKDQ